MEYYQSPLGLLEVTSGRGQLTGCTFIGDRPGAPSCPDELTRLAIRQLEEYFAGRRFVFELPFQVGRTAFQKAVVNELLHIPFGDTITYAELARRVHSPSGSRAAGGVISRNPLLIIIPCHRVVGQNGSLTGYAGGVELKQWLISHEMNLVHPPGRLF